MKNKSLLLPGLLVVLLSSCSTYMANNMANKFPSKGESREVASAEYECTFSEMISGHKTEFSFSPASMKLAVESEKFGKEVVYLEEDNFISGGFSFVMDKGANSKQWPIKKVEFVSFSTRPKLTINFLRTPASKKEETIARYCE